MNGKDPDEDLMKRFDDLFPDEQEDNDAPSAPDQYADHPMKEYFPSDEIQYACGKIDEIPRLSPRDIEERLLEAGYRGQKLARRAGSILAYRHIMRLRRSFIEGRALRDLPGREHYLFLGTTGSGKTFLAELLFREILKVPTLVADATRFSETGYIGDDVQMLLSQLYEAADNQLAWASCGVCCIDEFDKLATSRSSARFAGEGTTKDVSGFGVQRGLLTLLSADHTTFPGDFGFSGHGAQIGIPLHNLMFIACGAFSGLQEVSEFTKNEELPAIGFGGKSKSLSDEAIAMEMGISLLENTTAFAKYGMLPELIGRFSRLVPFQPLELDVLRQILHDNLLKQYYKEFEEEGVNLTIDDQVLEEVINAAKRRETGARGLRASLVPHLEEAAFESFGNGKKSSVKLTWKDGRVEVK